MKTRGTKYILHHVAIPIQTARNTLETKQVKGVVESRCFSPRGKGVRVSVRVRGDGWVRAFFRARVRAFFRAR